MGDVRSLITKFEQRNSLISMMRDSITEIINEFNTEIKNNGYSMQEAMEVLRDRNYPAGTFCVRINQEPFIIMLDEVIESLHQGYEKSAVKATIYDIITEKIKCK